MDRLGGLPGPCQGPARLTTRGDAPPGHVGTCPGFWGEAWSPGTMSTGKAAVSEEPLGSVSALVLASALFTVITSVCAHAQSV